jgi:RNA-directed DNA polymerase
MRSRWAFGATNVPRILPLQKKVCNFVGGVASPWVANIALHGLEEFRCAHFPTRTRRNPAHPGRQLHGHPQVIRYADDLVILPRERTVIEHGRPLTQAGLQGIGRELSAQQTHIAHTRAKVEGDAGFHCLGFQVRQSRASQDKTARGRGVNTRLRPRQEAVKRPWARLSALSSQPKAAKPAKLIGLRNPLSAGWAHSSSAVVRTRTFPLLAHRLYAKLRRWAFVRHPRQGRRWVVQRYGDTTSGTSWDFRDHKGPTLHRPTRVPMVRHVKVPGKASLDDGPWSYGAARRGTDPGVSRRLATRRNTQAGHCAAGGLYGKPEGLSELHHRDGNRSDNRDSNLAAVHRHCHDQIPGGFHELSKR